MLIAVLYWSIVLHYLDDIFAILPPSANASLYGQQFDDVSSYVIYEASRGVPCDEH